MKCRKNRCGKKKFQTGHSFKVIWEKILENTPNYHDKIRYYEKDFYFEETPLYQTLLTHSYNISKNKIDYSNFIQISSDQINSRNLFDCFHGILNYIYYYSNNKFNIDEIEIHYSGSKSRISLKEMIRRFNTNSANDYNITNIFDYENIETQFLIQPQIDAFFGVTFKRIKVNAISYSIRSGHLSNLSSHLVSFTFEGYDEINDRWDILDERQNSNDLVFTGSYQMFFVKKTEKYYSSFKIKQTCPGNNDFWGFTISAFEIHGFISYRDDINTQNEFLFKSNINIETEYLDTNKFISSYDPMMDMTEYI